jgi:hypothetical protein
MSVEALSRAWDNSIHKGSELLVLVAIAENSNDDTDSTYLSIEFISWKTRLSRRSVQRIIRVLEESGELLIQRNRGRNGTNVYRINTKPGNYALRPNTRNVSFDAFDEGQVEHEAESRGVNLAPVPSEVFDAPNSVVETPNSVVEDTPDGTRTVVVPYLEPLKNRRESETAFKTSQTIQPFELLEIEDVVKEHPTWPTWYAVAYTVPGWAMGLAQADGWRNMAKITADLAERVAYALRDWWPTSSDKRQKKGDPYKTWQNWCRRERDVVPGNARGAQRQPVRTGATFRGYGE